MTLQAMPATGNVLYQGTTIYGGSTGIIFTAGSAEWSLRNNIFSNATGKAVIAGGSTGFLFHNNLYFKSSGDRVLVVYNGSEYTDKNIKIMLDANAVTSRIRISSEHRCGRISVKLLSNNVPRGRNLGSLRQDATHPRHLTWPGEVGVQGTTKGTLGAFAH
ncbi:hypothetical protein ACTMU2_37225 [Cupriavidus basilensis]